MTTTTNTETTTFIPYGARGDDNFKPADEVIALLEGNTWPRALFVPAADALAWDRPLASTNRATYSEVGECFCYCEVKVTGRVLRTFTGGYFGLKCRVRFTGAELLPEDQGWIDAVLIRGEGVTR
jgi:hypothetical protein